MGNCIERYQQGMMIDGVAGRQIGQTSLSDRYIKDHLGSVQRVIRENGTEENEYIYDSFGNIIYQSGTLSNQRLYTSRYYDSESGLYYYRARYYDSNTGRFISEDPIGFAGGVNLYGYVENNPLKYTDPRGLNFLCKVKCHLKYIFKPYICIQNAKTCGNECDKTFFVGTDKWTECHHKCRKELESCEREFKEKLNDCLKECERKEKKCKK